MDVEVAIDDGVALPDGLDDQAIASDAIAMLAVAGLEDAELSVVLTDDDRIRALNATWRDKDEPTDVLSFPQQEGEVVGGLLGDVVISVETAAVQAVSVGHDLRAELRVLLAHGLLHLLGHDHGDEGSARAMREAEERLLAVVGTGRGLVERAGGLR